MAVPITGATLRDVKTEIEGNGGGTVTSLKDAHDNESNASGFDPIYAVTGDTLKDFRNYSHDGDPPTVPGNVRWDHTIWAPM